MGKTNGRGRTARSRYPGDLDIVRKTLPLQLLLLLAKELGFVDVVDGDLRE